MRLGGCPVGGLYCRPGGSGKLALYVGSTMRCASYWRIQPDRFWAGRSIFFLLGRWNFPRSAYILEWLLSLPAGVGRAAGGSRLRHDAEDAAGERKRPDQDAIYGAGSGGLASLGASTERRSDVRCDRVGR